MKIIDKNGCQYFLNCDKPIMISKPMMSSADSVACQVSANYNLGYYRGGGGGGEVFQLDQWDSV